jgi:hypothetical protein
MRKSQKKSIMGMVSVRYTGVIGGGISTKQTGIADTTTIELVKIWQKLQQSFATMSQRLTGMSLYLGQGR